jgi:hypothetical protein
MKKLVLLTFMVLALVLSGCSAAEVDEPVDVAEAEDISEEIPEEPEELEEEEEEIPIHPDQIPWDINILEPNSIGSVYMEATFTNNTDYPITRYHMKVHLKDKNDTTYLTSHDTVMPGETSPIFDSFGPETMDPNDYEVLTLAVRAILDNGDELDIEYDFKLGQAYWDIYEK